MFRISRNAAAGLAVMLVLLALLVSAGAASAATGGTYTWVWQNPLPKGHLMFSTSAFSTSTVWSVGEYGRVILWNGSRLVEQASGTTASLYGVDPIDASNVWAVGEGKTILRTTNGGATWTAETAPDTGYGYDLWGVAALSNTNVYAVGGYDGFSHALVLHRDASGWHVEQHYDTGGFMDVFAYSASAVWVVGQAPLPIAGRTLFYNGSTWSLRDTTRAPMAVSAYSASNVFVVDWDGTVLRSTNGGASYTPIMTGEYWPASVSAISSTRLWVVGWDGNIRYSTNNGSSWTPQTSNTTSDICDVWARSTTTIYCAGDEVVLTSTNTGGTWTPRTGGTTGALNAVSGRDADNVMAGGAYVSATYRNVQMSADGGEVWTPSNAGNYTVYGLAYFDSANAWASCNGLVRKWSGSAWSSAISVTGRTFYCIAAAAANRVWAGQDNGRVRYYNGSAWTEQVTSNTNALYGISAASTTTAWAVGAAGTILYTANAGTNWSPQTSNTPNTLRAVKALNTTTAWAVGDGGTIRYTNNSGTTWQTQASGTTQNLLGVSAADATHVWAVGAAGTILFYDGATWTPQTSPTTNTLRAVFAFDANDAWAVGDSGTIIFADPPYVKACVPEWGNPGDTLDAQIIGGYTHFTDSTPVVSLGEGVSIVPGSQRVVDNTHVLARIRVEPGAELGLRDVSVTSATEVPIPLKDGFTVGAPPPPPPPSISSKWYLAEGSTAWGFDTNISVVNPNAEAVTVKVTYYTPGGPVGRPNIKMPPESRVTINPMNEDELLSDFSTKVECLEGKTIAADRTMYWRGEGAAGAEGHSSIGVTAPATTWYMAEGSSAWGFECWLLIQNPGATDATCQVTYMTDGLGQQTVKKTVPAHSRKSFNMADDIGAKDASIKVASDVPVIPERSMYRNNRREGHNSIGVTDPATDYYLAEGSTAWGFTTYVLVQNPNPADAQVTLTYMTPGGKFAQPPLTVPANSRRTVRVNDALPGVDVSTRVWSNLPVIAERAMYWDAGLGEACHDSIGASAPASQWWLPDGQSGHGFERTFETWTLVQNPNDVPVKVRLTYLNNSGTGNKTFTDTVPANSRRTYDMAEHITDDRAGIKVESLTAAHGVIVERSMYWDNRSAGTDTIGGRPASF